MQISPYRLQLAGVKTAPVEYRPLVREIVGMGFIRSATGRDSERLTVQVQIADRDRPLLSVDQEAEARHSSPEAPPARARLTAIHPQAEFQSGSVLAEFQLESAAPAWQPGGLATIVIRKSLADVEPYRSQAQPIPPLRPLEHRVAYVSLQRPDVVRLQPGASPTGDGDLQRVELAENQRIDWWCPMHPEVFAAEDGHQCAKCNGMKLLPRIVTYAPSGHVLAVPASAVLDSGPQQLVFVEVSPGMLEGRQVQLGTRAGSYYPVLAGLSPGNVVVSAGSFLLDAETRLSGQASTAYFGAASATNP
jgi:Cu(I)/Ag(I) efflux system membrane fusion protein